MLQSLYNWTMRQAAHPYSTWIMGAVSFIESSVFPIPPDIMLIPMVLAKRAKAFFFALVATITSVAGGFLGYAIGALLFVEIAQPILETYGYLAKFEEFRGTYNDWGAWAVFIAGVTPFPYKVITITSGATGLDLIVFGVASIAARGLRFGIVCGLLYFFGQPIKAFIEKRLGLMFTLFVILLVGGFVAIKFL